MPQKIIGNIREYYADGVAIQPGYKLAYKDDGTITGTVTFEGDLSDIGNVPPIGQPHPRESRCELYAGEYIWLASRKFQYVASYFGITKEQTDPVISNGGNADRASLATHPDFVSTLGGTPDSPLNGAIFDPDTLEFLGFNDQSLDELDLYGSRYYFVPSTMVSLSYWTRSAPTLKNLLTIHASLPGYAAPPNVADFLLLTSPYRQVGTHYQVTENYMGSGPNGWNPNVYEPA